MSRSLPAAELEAKVVRYLLVQGKPCDFASIRHGAELAKLARGDLWAAIRSLTQSQQVSYAYRHEVTTYEGFQQSMSYPVFWVNRDAVVAGGYSLPDPARSWWTAYLTQSRGKGKGVLS